MRSLFHVAYVMCHPHVIVSFQTQSVACKFSGKLSENETSEQLGNNMNQNLECWV